MTEKQNKKTNENVNPSSLEVSNDDAFGLWMKKAQHMKKHNIGLQKFILTLKRALVIDCWF